MADRGQRTRRTQGTHSWVLERGQLSSLRRWVGGAPIYIHATVNAKTMWFHYSIGIWQDEQEGEEQGESEGQAG